MMRCNTLQTDSYLIKYYFTMDDYLMIESCNGDEAWKLHVDFIIQLKNIVKEHLGQS